MICLELQIDELDYDSLFELLLPLAEERLASKPDSSLARLLSGGNSPGMLKALLKIFSQSQKDKMAAELINANSEKLAEKIEELARSQGISGRVAGISASTKC